MAAQEKPRIFQDGQDMVLSIGLLVLVMFVSVGFTGLCTFNPGAPENGPVQEVDAKTFTDMEARSVTYPVRYPEMPEGWVTNSARRSMIGGEPAPVIGWVTPDTGYVAMTQTSADLTEAIKAIDEDPRQNTDTVRIAGEDVQKYTSEERDVRDVWAVDLDDVRLVFTGAGTDAEFEELISTAIDTAPINTSVPVD
ncbi:DUF4245 domain-containing protein [Corynebacterium lubricantis]|uniref:DUF4245 domain-containing protein n=1 Tax=Corynebacterium lubricantis TaxID=541095 RepID=UPI00036051F6|nr:DUF4245 domain-containing protein [Corynebacterium lubricantis]